MELTVHRNIQQISAAPPQATATGLRAVRPLVPIAPDAALVAGLLVASPAEQAEQRMDVGWWLGRGEKSGWGRFVG